MSWLGLFAGILVGAAFWGVPGALVLGFFGWLAGIIFGSRSARAKPAPASAPRPVAEQPVGVRLERLERGLARIEERLAKLEGVSPEAGVAAQEAMASATIEAAPAQEAAATQGTAAGASVAEAAAGEAREAGAPPELRASAQAAPVPSEPPPPAAPNPLVAWITGGNAIARVGLLILFFGLAFLLKYAADRDLMPVEFRVGGVALAGVALLVTGWRLRFSRPGYALGLQGAAVAVLYLTTFAALRLYGLLPAGMAFALLAAIAALSAFLAVRQDALVLAAFGAGGGFLAPILASTGGGSHVMLFSYYLLLNAGILAIAFNKAWRSLNVMGFLFTFFIGLLWGLRYYRPEHFATTEPFLVAFFVLYVWIAVLFARRQAPRLTHYVDGTLVFGVPLAAFGLQAGLTRGMEFALAYSCLGLSATYLGLAAWLRRGRNPNLALLVEAFLALGVVFASLAIPLALDAQWTSAAWALEGAAIVWVGTRQRRRLARAFGVLLEFGAGVAYLNAYPRLTADVPLVDAGFLGAALVALAGLWTNRLLRRAQEQEAAKGSAWATIAFLWGMAWWLFAARHEIETFVEPYLQLNAYLEFFAGTALVFSYLAVRKDWREAAWPALALLPVLFACALAGWDREPHLFANFGAPAWVLAFGAQLWVLLQNERHASPGYFRGLHAGTLLLAALVGALELHWVAQNFTAYHTAWSVASVVVVPALLVIAVSSAWAGEHWPVAAQPRAYRVGAVIPIAVAFMLWVLYANATHNGDSYPLPYLPLLNALDLAHILVGLALLAAWNAWRRAGFDVPALVRGRLAGGVVAAATFLWLNGVLLRTLHHWADIPYRLESMSRSVLAQASLSIFWALIALSLMVFATRRARRPLWLLGAGLMAVVVVKLFLIDLSHLGGIERIVSFIGVGVLMVVIGYFSPVPPRAGQEKS